jgi:AraC-like DNA-binding protein
MRDVAARECAILSPATPEPPPGIARSAAEPIRLSLQGVPEHERPGLYREFFGRSVMRLDAEALPDHPFEVDVTLQRLPGLMLFAGTLHGSRTRRTREMLADGVDDVCLMVNLGGPYFISHGRHELVLGDGEATFLSSAEVCSFMHHPPGGLLALRVPRLQFAPLVSRMDDCYLRHIPHDSQALKLLTNYVDMARHERAVASGELRHLVVAHAYDLMAMAIGATRDAAHAAQGRGLRAAQLQAIKQDIARNLAHGDLSVATVAARNGCTPRCLQRLFEADETTFTGYVLAQRLVRAHRMLTDPCRANDKILTVAQDCGFSSLSYFNRVFRRQYGAAPSEIRAQARLAT